MTRSELVTQLMQLHPLLSQREAELVVDIVFDEISRAMQRGQRIELRGFGVFSTRLRAPRQARNPKTGEKLLLSHRKVPFFRIGKELKQRLNSKQPKSALKS